MEVTLLWSMTLDHNGISHDVVLKKLIHSTHI